MNSINSRGSKTKNFLIDLWKNKQSKVGIILLTTIVLIAIFSPLISPFDPYFLGEKLMEAPSSVNPLGTDGMGRDVMSMIFYGARVSLMVGIISAMIAGVIGTLLGGIAGYFGGRIDQIVSEIIDIFLMIPTFFLVLIIIALFGSSLLNVMIVIGLTSWPGNARLMRSQALALRERVFVKGAEAIGESKFVILFRYIIPNGIFPIIANTTMRIAGAILTEASLSFLGLGDPNVISWGQMIYAGKGYMTTAWWVSTFAGLAIVCTVMAFYLIGDGLNTILNPKLKSPQ